MTAVVAPGENPKRDGEAPLAIFKPIPLIAGFSMLDFAIHDTGLIQQIETTVRDAGGEIERD